MKRQQKNSTNIGIRNMSGVKCDLCDKLFEPGQEINILEWASIENKWKAKYAHRDHDECMK